MKQYLFSKIWVSQILESRFPFRIQNPILASIVKIGTIPNLTFIIFCAIRYEYITTTFLIAYILGMIWLNLGPFLIWHYDQRLQPDFFKKVSAIVPDQERLNALATKYGNLFRKRFWILTVPWTLIVTAVWVTSISGLALEGGIFGLGDVFYWVWFVIIFITAIVSSIGFWGVLVTILAIRGVSREKSLRIDPLHPDKMGGLSTVGSYAIGTTLLFSSGSLYLPLGFQLASGSELATSFIYLAALLFSAFILLSFLGPTLIVHRRAKSIRNTALGELREKYTEQSHTLDINDENSMAANICYLKLSRIRSEYLDYQNVKLYPFEVGILVKLITSVVLPLLFLLIKQGYISLGFLGF